MFLRLLALFIFVPLAELILLLRLADATSWLVTLAIVIGTGVLGTILARREGVAAWLRFQGAVSKGQMPTQEIQDGLMVAIASILLLTPGLITDTIGFALLTPWGRRAIGGFFRRRFAGSVQFHSTEEHFQFERTASPMDQEASTASGSRWTIDSPSFGPKTSSHHGSRP